MIRRVAPLALVLAVLVAAGCFVDSGGAATATASGGDTTSTSTSSTTTAATADTSTTAPASTTASTTTTTTTTSTSSTADPTTSTTSASTDPITTSTAGSTTAGPASELLTHTARDACKQPLWCYKGDVLTGVQSRVWAQECFTSALAGPLAITELHYTVAAILNADQLTKQHVEVYSRNPAGPAELIESREITAADVAVGDHALALDPPIVAPDASFCVGLSVGASMLSENAAVGLAVGDAPPPPGSSYFKMTAADACNLPEFSDIAVIEPTPSGHWCVAAQVVEAE